MADKIKQRRDTQANWEAVNPILDQGELGWITDRNTGKLGDGVTAFNDLQGIHGILEGWINVRDFGAKGDGITDDTLALQNVLNSHKSIYFPAGTYIISKPLLVYSGTSILGSNWTNTIIQKNTNESLGYSLTTIAPGRTGINDEFNVDAIFVLYHDDNTYNYRTSIKNLRLKGISTTIYVNYGIYAPRTAHLSVENINTYYLNRMFFTYDSWLATFKHMHGDYCNNVFTFANDGSNSGTGTTLSAEDCSTTKNVSLTAYYIYGLSYSTFKNCGVDNLTSAARAYDFELSHGITLIGCAIEGKPTSDQLLRYFHFYYSEIALISCFTYGLAGSSNGDSVLLFFDHSKANLLNCYFQDFTDPLQTKNITTQGGSIVNILNTRFPSNGNSWNSFANGSRINYLDNNGISTQTAYYKESLDFWKSGATTNRPTNPALGTRYFDTTLGKPIWYNGTNWVDATGAIV